MKTAQANLGLGDAVRRRRKTRGINQRDWRFRRIAFFQRNVRFAAAAKAFRVANDVTQVEVAKVFGCSQSTVCCWESGKYSWPLGQDELNDYIATIRRIVKS